MWIGSNVPPKIPVRTSARIGRRRGDQTERPGDVGVPASQLASRVDVLAVDPGREMNPIDPVGRAGFADDLTSLHDVAGRHRDPGQVGDRHLESGHRLDGHRSHPGDRPGEGDSARGRSPGLRPDRDRIVDAPVTAERSHRGVLPHHRPIDRGHETDCSQHQPNQHLSLQPRTYRRWFGPARGISTSFRWTERTDRWRRRGSA